MTELDSSSICQKYLLQKGLLYPYTTGTRRVQPQKFSRVTGFDRWLANRVVEVFYGRANLLLGTSASSSLNRYPLVSGIDKVHLLVIPNIEFWSLQLMATKYLTNLARALLGQPFDDLSSREQHVIESLVSGEPVAENTNQVFQDQTTYSQRLADSLAQVIGSWPFIFSFSYSRGWVLTP